MIGKMYEKLNKSLYAETYLMHYKKAVDLWNARKDDPGKLFM